MIKRGILRSTGISTICQSDWKYLKKLKFQIIFRLEIYKTTLIAVHFKLTFNFECCLVFPREIYLTEKYPDSFISLIN